MSKITYYPTMFHTNPFTFNMMEMRDQERKDAWELLLNNSKVKEIGVLKMMLNVVKFSVFDRNGNEYIQRDIPNQLEFNSKGIDTEFFVNIENTLKLKAGTYTSVRFYLASTGNSFIYDHWGKEDIYHLEHLDFEIWNGLKLKSNAEFPVRMRFDFNSFSLTSYFRSIKNIFKRSKPQTGRLLNC
ncbi:MAG: hypothetical protein WBN59_06060 [Flavobacteriaceae bacterium]